MRSLMRAALTAAFLLCGSVLGHQVFAHSWYTISGCCGGQDCTSLEAGDLKFTLSDDGAPAWVVMETGEVIPADETRDSPDRMNHRCVYLSGEREGMTRRTTIKGERVWCLWIAEAQF